jgi:signal peptidase II
MQNRLLWWIALCALVLDRVSKYWVASALPLGASFPLWSGVFHLTHITNRGAAFSLFADFGSALLPWISVLVSLGIAIYGWLAPPLVAWERWGYGLILGGAVGNGFDRVLTGEVVDFFDFRLINFAVFNVADSAICIGVACLFLASFQSKTPPEGNE